MKYFRYEDEPSKLRHLNIFKMNSKRNLFRWDSAINKWTQQFWVKNEHGKGKDKAVFSKNLSDKLKPITRKEAFIEIL